MAMTLRLPEQLDVAAKQRADAEHRSKHDLVVKAVEMYLAAAAEKDIDHNRRIIAELAHSGGGTSFASAESGTLMRELRDEREAELGQRAAR